MRNISLVLLTCTLFLSGHNRAGAQSAGAAGGAEYRRISPAQARTMMLELYDFILLDVRTAEEFRERRIEGAVNIPHNEIRRRSENELSDKSRAILVYCQSGRRSENAARALVSLGYTNVFDLGGIVDWPHETVSGL